MNDNLRQKQLLDADEAKQAEEVNDILGEIENTVQKARDAIAAGRADLAEGWVKRLHSRSGDACRHMGMLQAIKRTRQRMLAQ